jgi:hypothetical protein
MIKVDIKNSEYKIDFSHNSKNKLTTCNLLKKVNNKYVLISSYTVVSEKNFCRYDNRIKSLTKLLDSTIFSKKDRYEIWRKYFSITAKPKTGEIKLKKEI